MGSLSPESAKQFDLAQRRYAREEKKRVNAERMALADKIVMAITDKIANDIIRPGPKPEERECYVMAKELRDLSKELSLLVSDILKIEKEEISQ